MNVEDLIGATFALCYRVNHKKISYSCHDFREFGTVFLAFIS
jgi:hypothetical protein